MQSFHSEQQGFVFVFELSVEQIKLNAIFCGIQNMLFPVVSKYMKFAPTSASLNLTHDIQWKLNLFNLTFFYNSEQNLNGKIRNNNNNNTVCFQMLFLRREHSPFINTV